MGLKLNVPTNNTLTHEYLLIKILKKYKQVNIYFFFVADDF